MKSFINNIQKDLKRKGEDDWHYKEDSIKGAAKLIFQCPKWEEFKTATFIPVPPSVKKGEPLYDDRLVQILALIKNKDPSFDYQELILINKN